MRGISDTSIQSLFPGIVALLEGWPLARVATYRGDHCISYITLVAELYHGAKAIMVIRYFRLKKKFLLPNVVKSGG